MAIAGAAVILAACSGVTPAPSRLPADIQAQSTLAVSGCVTAGSGTQSCSYSGQARNLGTGCAGGVRGVTTTYMDQTLVGTSQWVYRYDVRPQETFVYSQSDLLFPAGSQAWTYKTTVAWDNVPCL
jgi:hypothetical protein